MAENYSRKQFRFLLAGIDLSTPDDAGPDYTYPIAQNVRSYEDFEIRARPGLTLHATLGTSVHSIKRLNDRIAASFVKLAGTGTELQNSSATVLATGFSGSPLTFVTVAPARTPRPWCYVGDSTKMVKTKVGASSAVNWG